MISPHEADASGTLAAEVIWAWLLYNDGQAAVE